MDGTFAHAGYCLGSVNNQSKDACQNIFSEASSLLAIKNHATMKFLKESVVLFKIEQQQFYKIGLKSVFLDNANSNESNIHTTMIRFYWPDGTAQTVNYFQYSIDKLPLDQEYCVQMQLFDDLHWYTYDCSSTATLRASLCQYGELFHKFLSTKSIFENIAKYYTLFKVSMQQLRGILL